MNSTNHPAPTKEYKRKADGVNRDLLQEMHSIADANMSNFIDDYEFRLWAQNIARDAIIKAQRGMA